MCQKYLPWACKAWFSALANFFDYPQAIYDECKDYNRAHHSDDGVNPHAGFDHGIKDTGYDTADGDDIVKLIAW